MSGSAVLWTRISTTFRRISTMKQRAAQRTRGRRLLDVEMHPTVALGGFSFFVPFVTPDGTNRQQPAPLLDSVVSGCNNSLAILGGYWRLLTPDSNCNSPDSGSCRHSGRHTHVSTPDTGTHHTGARG